MIKIDETKLQEKESGEAKTKAREYLSATDWYVTRYSETGIAIPDDVKAKRQECREVL